MSEGHWTVVIHGAGHSPEWTASAEVQSTSHCPWNLRKTRRVQSLEKVDALGTPTCQFEGNLKMWHGGCRPTSHRWPRKVSSPDAGIKSGKGTRNPAGAGENPLWRKWTSPEASNYCHKLHYILQKHCLAHSTKTNTQADETSPMKENDKNNS